MRTVAIVATVVALLGISVPFTWVSHAEPEVSRSPRRSWSRWPAPEAMQAGAADGAACVANAKPAKDFTLPGLDGKPLTLSAYKGKVVLLNFWATWCGPCKAEIPGFVELQQQYKNDLVVVGLSVDDHRGQGQGVRRPVQGQLPDGARARAATTSRTPTGRFTAFPPRS